MIPIAGAVTFLGLYYLATEDGGGVYYGGGYGVHYDSDLDDDDNLAGIGALIFWTTQTYGALDAIISANKINRQSGFGHLIEFDGDRVTFGVDPVASRKRLGTVLTLRF